MGSGLGLGGHVNLGYVTCALLSQQRKPVTPMGSLSAGCAGVGYRPPAPLYTHSRRIRRIREKPRIGTEDGQNHLSLLVPACPAPPRQPHLPHPPACFHMAWRRAAPRPLLLYNANSVGVSCVAGPSPEIRGVDSPYVRSCLHTHRVCLPSPPPRTSADPADHACALVCRDRKRDGAPGPQVLLPP